MGGIIRSMSHLTFTIILLGTGTVSIACCIAILRARMLPDRDRIYLFLCFQIVACMSMFAALLTAPSSFLRLTGAVCGILALVMTGEWFGLVRRLDQSWRLRREDEDDSGVRPL